MRSELQHEQTSHTTLRFRELTLIYRIQSVALKAIHDFLDFKGLVQLMPVILSPITDPLNHPVHKAQINSGFGQELQLTKSMIFHKQIAIASLDVKGIYIMSPNIRLEIGVKDSNRHLLEFTQVDIELKDETARDFISFMEELIVHVFTTVRNKCKTELDLLQVDLEIPGRPFQIFWSKALKKELGEEWETIVSEREHTPFWITDFEREFYDREDPKEKGRYINYDLFWPDGFGEALSGGERDYEYDVLLRKIKERSQDPSQFKAYLDLAEHGVLVPSVGGGLGVERLIRFLTRRKHIEEISIFPRVPGRWITV